MDPSATIEREDVQQKTIQHNNDNNLSKARNVTVTMMARKHSSRMAGMKPTTEKKSYSVTTTTTTAVTKLIQQ